MKQFFSVKRFILSVLIAYVVLMYPIPIFATGNSPQPVQCKLQTPIPRTTIPPKIDGILTDKSWKDAPTFPFFISQRKLAGSAQVAWDNTYIYFAVTIKNPGEPQAKSLSLFIDKDGKGDDFEVGDKLYRISETDLKGYVSHYEKRPNGKSFVADKNSANTFIHALKVDTNGNKTYEFAIPSTPHNSEGLNFPFKEGVALRFSLLYEASAHWEPAVYPPGFHASIFRDWPGIVLKNKPDRSLYTATPDLQVTTSTNSADVELGKPITLFVHAIDSKTCVYKIQFWNNDYLAKECISQTDCSLPVSPPNLETMQYKIIAYNALRGMKIITQKFTAHRPPEPPPRPPTLNPQVAMPLTPPANIKVTDRGTGHALAISWDRSPDPALLYVQVYRSKSPTVQGTLLVQTTYARVTMVVDDSAQEGVPYYYTLRAVDTHGIVSTLVSTPVLGIASKQ